MEWLLDILLGAKCFKAKQDNFYGYILAWQCRQKNTKPYVSLIFV